MKNIYRKGSKLTMTWFLFMYKNTIHKSKFIGTFVNESEVIAKAIKLTSPKLNHECIILEQDTIEALFNNNVEWCKKRSI